VKAIYGKDGSLKVYRGDKVLWVRKRKWLKMMAEKKHPDLKPWPLE